MNSLLKSFASLGLKQLDNGIPKCISGLSISRSLHTTPALDRKYKMHKTPSGFLKYNDVVYPPQDPNEPRRPAEVVHQRANIKYSTKNLMLISRMVRGMSVDEAAKQLSFYWRKGGGIVKEIIEEAQELAVHEHDVEFKSNMWIENAFVGKAKTVKGMRKHARRNPGLVKYRYTHFFIRLREGKPPKHYFPPPPTGNQLIEDQLNQLRDRQILYSM